MKTNDLKSLGVTELTPLKTRNVQGGILLGLWGLLSGAIKFVVNEVVDFGGGVKEGFDAVVKYE